jgi:hypothetical protein
VKPSLTLRHVCRFRSASAGCVALLAVCLAAGGCPTAVPGPADGAGGLQHAADVINGRGGVIQSEDPRDLSPPSDQDIVIDETAALIDDVLADLDPATLDQIVLVAIENHTDFDLSVGYNVDDEFQGVFVFSGETLLLEYDCFDRIELLFEDDFEPETGLFVGGFDLLDSLFVRPDNFLCGDVLFVTFTPDEITAVAEPLQ